MSREEINKLIEEGNSNFKNKNINEAIKKYSDCIDLIENNDLVEKEKENLIKARNNRSTCYILNVSF
jgi:outer membrane protein assembly factor BamD (BamD/ComL family)